jgi:salicylate hydroxylase
MASETKNPINVAIVRAGIGDLTLVFGLLCQNIPFTLYESTAAYSMVGAGVGLGPNAQRAIDMLEPNFKYLYNGISTGNVTPCKSHVYFTPG